MVARLGAFSCALALASGVGVGAAGCRSKSESGQDGGGIGLLDAAGDAGDVGSPADVARAGDAGDVARHPVGTWPPAMTTNDAATIAGAMFGKCDGVVPRRKKIPLVINGGSPDFGYGDAYLVEDPARRYIATFFGLVTNLGSTMHCNIAAPPNGYDWYDPQGRSMNVTVGPKILGSEGDVGSPVYVQSCLGPGETGVIVDIRSGEQHLSLFDGTGSIALALTYAGDGAVVAPALIPQRYNADSLGFLIVFKNTGTKPARLPKLISTIFPGTFVAFDQDGLPVWWGQLSQSSGVGPVENVVAVGAEGFVDTIDTIPGCGSQLRAYVHFVAEDAPSYPF